MSNRAIFLTCLLLPGVMDRVRAEDEAHPPEEPPAELAGAVAGFFGGLSDLPEAGEELPGFVALSPFCPEDEVAKYRALLQEWADMVETSDFEVSAPWMIDGDLAYVMVRQRDRESPLETTVYPLCLARVDGEWRIAPGLHHYDHVPMGFAAERFATARRLAREARRHAVALGQQAREEAIRELRGRIEQRRAAWPQDETPRQRILRYLEFDRERDVEGKAACLLLPERISADEMSGLMEKLRETLWESYDGSSDVPEFGEPLFLDAHEAEGGAQRVEMVGFVNLRDPGDCFAVPFFLKKSPKGWMMMPMWLELSHSDSPHEDLLDWAGAEEPRALRMIPRKLARDIRVDDPAEAQRLFLKAMCEGDHAGVYGLILMPDIERVEEDEWMSWLSGLMAKIRPQDGPPAMFMPLDSVTDGGCAVAHAVVFQPVHAEPMFIVSCFLWKTDGGWKVVPELGFENPETTHQAEAARVRAFRDFQKRHRNAGGQQRLSEAARRFFQPSEQRHPANAEETTRQLLAAARGDDFTAFFRLVGEPLEAGSELLALTALGRLLRELRSQPEIITPDFRVSGDWSGVILPIIQPRRAESAQPRRMLVLRNGPDGWLLVPGLEFYREVNRGFKLLNARSGRLAQEQLQREDFEKVEELRAWNENHPDSGATSR